MTALELRGITKTFGSTVVLAGIDLAIDRGDFVVFVGPSGCGKSTLLRIVAGLEKQSAGELRIAGVRADGLPPAKRGIGMVFQSYALYPHLTVAGNLSLALKRERLGRVEIERRVAAAAEILALTPLLQRKPAALSGGERQRVAIGRAIVRQPQLFLFDEPLSNLDAALRVQTRLEIANLHRILGTTMVYVTHDQTEAMTLADKIVVLFEGAIAQVGTPTALYETPANLFVAGFIGSPKMNFLGGADAQRLGATTLGIRPEHLRVSGADARWQGKVRHTEYLGSDTYLYVDVEAGSLTVRLTEGRAPHIGATVGLEPSPQSLHRFDEAGRAIVHR